MLEKVWKGRGQTAKGAVQEPFLVLISLFTLFLSPQGSLNMTEIYSSCNHTTTNYKF